MLKSKVEALYSKVQSAIVALSDLGAHVQSEIDHNQSQNTVRQEMFVLTNKKGFLEEILTVNFIQSNHFSESESFMSQHAKVMREISKPLVTVFVTNQVKKNLWRLSSPVKGQLVLLAEMAVKLEDIHPFEGRIMRQIKSILVKAEGSGPMRFHAH